MKDSLFWHNIFFWNKRFRVNRKFACRIIYNFWLFLSSQWPWSTMSPASISLWTHFFLPKAFCQCISVMGNKVFPTKFAWMLFKPLFPIRQKQASTGSEFLSINRFDCEAWRQKTDEINHIRDWRVWLLVKIAARRCENRKSLTGFERQQPFIVNPDRHGLAILSMSCQVNRMIKFHKTSWKIFHQTGAQNISNFRRMIRT